MFKQLEMQEQATGPLVGVKVLDLSLKLPAASDWPARVAFTRARFQPGTEVSLLLQKKLRGVGRGLGAFAWTGE